MTGPDAFPPPDRPKRATIRERLTGSFSHAPRSIGLLWRSSPGGAVAMGALGVVHSTLPVAMAWVAKLIIDAVVTASGMPAGPGRDAAVRNVVLYIAIEFGLVALQALLGQASNIVRVLAGSRLSQFIHVLVLEKAISLELRQFENPAFYDRLTRARREAGSHPISVVTALLSVGSATLTLLAFIAVLIGFSPWIALALGLAAIPPVLVERLFADRQFHLVQRRSPESRELNYLEQVMTTDTHAKEVRLFQLGEAMLGRFKALAAKLLGEDRRLAIDRIRLSLPLSLVSTATFYACYLFVAIAATRGDITIGDVAFYMAAFRQSRGGLEMILQVLAQLYESNLYMRNLFDFLDEVTPYGGGPSPSIASVPAGVPSEGLVFDRVGFRYPSGQWALRGISFQIRKGQSLALVGKNGAGKTTVIKLMTRLYEPTEGRIFLDGRDLRDFGDSELRARMGAIFQDFNKSQFVLRENIGVGSIMHLADDARAGRAVAAAGAEDVVAGLAKGLDAQLGTWFAGGVELSGGQWQKVALARAFFREQADILVLDEPTATLDAEAEHEVFERFRALPRGKTTVLISHRFASVRSADRIVVLDEGRIVEEGSHTSLLAAGGHYARLFALQAAGYL